MLCSNDEGFLSLIVDKRVSSRGGLGIICEVRFCCGKSVRAPRFYFTS